MISASSLVTPAASSPPRRAYRGWLAYAAAWTACAGLWTFASTSSGRVSLLEAAPYSLLVMGTAAALGVGVWHLTAYLPWRASRPRFYAGNAIALPLYAFTYSIALFVPDFLRTDLISTVRAIRQSPIFGWNVLMGCWLYLMIAGLSYAIRSERARDQDAADAAEARLLAQQAQLTALRAQLNPHFLFNALHTVSALISHDPDGADRAIERLGELLRYAMADEELVPLSAEWRFVRDYLAFEQLRLGDRLRIVEHLDPAVADRLIPPLLLQPIVENAVRHGVAARPEGGSIHVEARLDGDAAILRVADDGPGSCGSENGRQGLGLASVRRRLAVVFGDGADLRIDHGKPGAGYVVSVTIPGSMR